MVNQHQVSHQGTRVAPQPVLWILNDSFRIRLRIFKVPELLMTRKFCLKTPYNQSKRRIYQLSAIFYFTLQSYLYNTIQSRNHRPKIRNKFLYLNTSRSLKEFWIRPDPDPEQIIPDPGKEFRIQLPNTAPPLSWYLFQQLWVRWWWRWRCWPPACPRWTSAPSSTTSACPPTPSSPSISQVHGPSMSI